MHCQPSNKGITSELNSTIVLLLANEIFEGEWERVENISSISILGNSDVSGTLYAQFSIDSINVNRTIQLSDGDDTDFGVHSLTAVAKYFRVRFVNGFVNQSSFYIQTVYNEGSRVALTTSRLNQSIGDYSDVLNTRSVIVGQNQVGIYSNVQLDLNGRLKISNGITTNTGESIDVTYYAVEQNTFLYGLQNNPQKDLQFIASGGSISTNTGNNIILAVNTTVGSYAVERSKRVLKYRHGMSNIIRISGKFSPGVTNSLQFIGVGTAESDLYFCMNGPTFGVRRSYNGRLQIVKLTITAASTGVESLTIILNGVIFNILTSAAGGLINFTAHQIEIGGTGAVSYTGWAIEHYTNTVTFIARSVGERNGLYSFTNNTGGGTAAASFTTLATGMSLQTEFVPQNSWNGNSPMIQSLDPISYNNLYEIEYLWFGSANILFKVYNYETGQYEIVHTMSFSNLSSQYSLSTPNMYAQLGIASLGSTTAMSLTSSGYFMATMGCINIQRLPKSAIAASKSISASTETVILSIQNRQQINGFSNQCEMILNDLSIAADGNRPVILKVILNPTTLGANTTTNYTNFQYVDQNYSLLGYDTTATTYSGGTILFQEIIPKNVGIQLQLFENEYFLDRDDIIVFSVFSTQANVVDLSLTVCMDY